MEIKESKLADFTQVELVGELDATTAPDLEDRLTALIEGGAHRLVLECSQLEYISSAGLRAFLLGAKLIRSANGKLGVTGMQELVRDVFDMAGFDDMFEFFPTPAEAVQALA